jgi:predicted membrane-bound spermidine synthase
VAAAGLALVVARAWAAGATPSGAAPEPVAAAGSARRRALWCAGAACGAGALLLALEIVWFRFLHLFVHGGSLAFAAMLATVLAGIGLGGLAAAWWIRRDAGADRHAATVALAAGMLSVASYAAFGRVLAPHGDEYLSALPDVLVLAAAIALPTSFASGALFTLTGVALRRAVPADVRAAGLLTLANTLGAAAGPLAAGFVLLPWLGMERSFFVLALGYGIVAAALARGAALRPRTGPALAAAGLLVVALALFPFGSMRTRFVELPIRRATLGKPYEVAAFREGRAETLVYLRYEFFDRPLAYQLVTDGYNMAGSGFASRRYMKQFVYLPVALAEKPPRSALLMCFGSGATAKALTHTRSLERIDVVDISRDVLALSDVVFPDPREHPLHDPRVRLHIEDGRTFLQLSDARYDLITGEPPPPKMAGVVNLYTREFFARVRERLADGGRVSYWLPAQNLTLSDTRAIVRAFCDVYDDCSLWQGFRLNWILLGSRGAARTGDPSAFAAQWNDPVVAAEMARLGFELPEQLGATFLADAPRLAELTSGAEPLVDDRPKRLSDPDPDPQHAEHALEEWMDTSRTAARFGASELVRASWPAELRERTLPYFDYQRMINEIYRWPPAPRDAYRSMVELHETITRTPLRTLVQWHVGLGSDESEVFRGLLASGERNPALVVPIGIWALADRDFAGAAGAFAASFRATGDANSLRMLLYSLCLAGRVDEARALAADASASGSPAATGESDRGYWRFMSETFGLRAP